MKFIVFAALIIAFASCGGSTNPRGYSEVSLSQITSGSDIWNAFEFGAEAVIEAVLKKFVVPNREFSSTIMSAWEKKDSNADYYQFIATLVNSDGGKVSASFTVKCDSSGKSLFSFKYNAHFPSKSETNIETEIEIEVCIEAENVVETETETEAETENNVEVEVEFVTEIETETSNYVPVASNGCYSDWLKNLITNGAKDVILAESKIPRDAYQLTEINSAEKKTVNGNDYYRFETVLKCGQNVLKINYTLKVDSNGSVSVDSYKWWYNSTN